MSEEGTTQPRCGITCDGMTLRDYFAASAMQALMVGSRDENGELDYIEIVVAYSAYYMADAMMNARTENTRSRSQGDGNDE